MHGAQMAVICPCTTVIHRKWAHRIQVTVNGRENEIMTDQIRAVSLKRFDSYICTLPANTITRLRDVIAKLYTM